MDERSRRQLKAILRKNWLLKCRHPLTTAAEVLLPTIVMLLLIAVRTSVDTEVHPTQPYIRKGMFVEVGAGGLSPSFDTLLKLWLATDEHLAFAPDKTETRNMLNLLSLMFPLLKPKMKGAVIFHECGPQTFDYSIRLNHSWAFSGFPDVNTIMDTNGPYVNDLELGASAVPTMQYGLSGFLTVMDLLIIFSSQVNLTDVVGNMKFVDDGGSSELYASEVTAENKKQQPVGNFVDQLHFKYPWTKFIPSTIRIYLFPTREYTDDEFQSIIKRIMGVLYLLGFLYPVSRLISYSVSETVREANLSPCSNAGDSTKEYSERPLDIGKIKKALYVVIVRAPGLDGLHNQFFRHSCKVVLEISYSSLVTFHQILWTSLTQYQDCVVRVSDILKSQNQIRKELGVCPQSDVLFPELTVGGRLQCIGSPHLKTRFGNHLELEVRPTDVTTSELDNLCSKIQRLLSDFPCHPRGALHDLEICIGGNDLILPADVSEICLSEEMVSLVARFLENEGRVRTLLSGRLVADGVFSQQLSEQLARDGGIPLRIFSEWWLAEEKFSVIDSFILSTFHGAIFQGRNGLNVKYQLPYGEDSSLAEIFGHLERNRSKLGISEYSISQSTLETIFNHFAGNS